MQGLRPGLSRILLMLPLLLILLVRGDTGTMLCTTVGLLATVSSREPSRTVLGEGEESESMERVFLTSGVGVEQGSQSESELATSGLKIVPVKSTDQY